MTASNSRPTTAGLMPWLLPAPVAPSMWAAPSSLFQFFSNDRFPWWKLNAVYLLYEQDRCRTISKVDPGLDPIHFKQGRSFFQRDAAAAIRRCQLWNNQNQLAPASTAARAFAVATPHVMWCWTYTSHFGPTAASYGFDKGPGGRRYAISTAVHDVNAIGPRFPPSPGKKTQAVAVGVAHSVHYPGDHANATRFYVRNALMDGVDNLVFTHRTGEARKIVGQ